MCYNFFNIRGIFCHKILLQRAPLGAIALYLATTCSKTHMSYIVVMGLTLSRLNKLSSAKFLINFQSASVSLKFGKKCLSVKQLGSG